MGCAISAVGTQDRPLVTDEEVPAMAASTLIPSRSPPPARWAPVRVSLMGSIVYFLAGPLESVRPVEEPAPDVPCAPVVRAPDGCLYSPIRVDGVAPERSRIVPAVAAPDVGLTVDDVPAGAGEVVDGSPAYLCGRRRHLLLLSPPVPWFGGRGLSCSNVPVAIPVSERDLERGPVEVRVGAQVSPSPRPERAAR